MPVQINEVIIRAVVDSSSTTTPAAVTNSVAGTAKPDVETAAQVLEIIKEKNER
jgi:hypothetical protein